MYICLYVFTLSASQPASHLHLSVFIYLSVYLSSTLGVIYRSISLSVCLSIHLSLYQSISPSSARKLTIHQSNEILPKYSHPHRQ